MYLLALDESGTHGLASCTLVAGIAVHELDVQPLERDLGAVLTKHLQPLGLLPRDHELHAADLINPDRGKPARGQYPATPPSRWLPVQRQVRQAIVTDAYAALRDYTPVDPAYPVALFGAVVERTHKTFHQADQEAYDHVLHRFDEMLARLNRTTSTPQRGLVLHDRRLQLEHAIQDMAELWRRTGARLDSLAQVPMFTDSKSSRLVQAADFVSYALWRHYSESKDPTYADLLWPMVDADPAGRLSGVIHKTPGFGRCPCLPCRSRQSGYTPGG